MTSFLDTVYEPTNHVSYGRRDILLTLIDDKGGLIWNRQIGSDSVEICGGITLNHLGDILVTGGFSKSCDFSGQGNIISNGNLDIFLANYSKNGDLIWTKNIGWGTRFQVTTDIIADQSSIILTGYYNGTLYLGNPSNNVDTLIGTTTYSSFIAKFDLNGDLIWSKSYYSSSNNSSFRRIGITENGYFFGGSYQGTMHFDIDTLVSISNSLDMFLYKTDLTGNGEWIRTFIGSATESFRSLETDEYLNAYILGSYSSSTLQVDSTSEDQNTYVGNLGGYDTFIAKYNRSGIMQWFVRKGSSSNDYYYDIAIRNNVIYTTGYFANQLIFNNDTLRTSGNANKDAFLGVFNEIGDPIAGVSVNGNGDYDDTGLSVSIDNSSKAYLIGSFKSPSITIGDSTFFNSHYQPLPAKSDLFFAIYQQPFQAVITDEKNVSCHGLSDGMLEVTPYFGRAPYVYSWSHNPDLNNPMATGLPAGTYTVTVTDANNAQAFKTETVTQPAPLATTGIVTPVSCFNRGDGAIDLTVTGGTAATDYAYFWSSLDGSGVHPLEQDQSGLTEGTYSLLVRDDNKCEITDAFVVTQPARFNYAGTLVGPIVIPPGNNGFVNLSVTGGNTPYTYAWSGPSGYTATTEDIANLGAAGLYALTLTDSKSCTADTTFAVIDNITMVAQVTAKTDVLCFGGNDGSATVTVYNSTATPFSYHWSDGITLVGIPTRTGMTPGNYTVVVTDAALNTTLPAPVTITGPAAGINLVLEPQALRCNGDQSGVVNLTVTGGTYPYQYSWDNGYTGEDQVNVPAGTYTVTVTDGNGCTSPGSAVVTEPGAIALDIAVSGTILCHGDNTAQATANASGGVGTLSYLWNDPGTQVTKTAFDLGAGNYTVVVTDENGCSRSGSTLITEPDALSLTTDITEPSCPGLSDGSLAPTVSGGTPGFDYQWSNNVFERFNTDLPAGPYTLTVTDQNNCVLVQSYTLSDPDTVKVTSVSVTDLTCSGSDDGSLAITATGGTGTYTYSADGGETFVSTALITGLAQGDYLVVVQDGNGCLSEDYPVTLTKSETCAMLIYDAFSPNDDGYNDLWHIGNVESYPDCSVKIINLWGITVFSSNGYGDPWDGKYNGNKLPSGTYYYIIDPGDGSESLTGSVNIVY